MRADTLDSPENRFIRSTVATTVISHRSYTQWKCCPHDSSTSFFMRALILDEFLCVSRLWEHYILHTNTTDRERERESISDRIASHHMHSIYFGSNKYYEKYWCFPFTLMRHLQIEWISIHIFDLKWLGSSIYSCRAASVVVVIIRVQKQFIQLVCYCLWPCRRAIIYLEWIAYNDFIAVCSHRFVTDRNFFHSNQSIWSCAHFLQRLLWT